MHLDHHKKRFLVRLAGHSVKKADEWRVTDIMTQHLWLPSLLLIIKNASTEVSPGFGNIIQKDTQ